MRKLNICKTLVALLLPVYGAGAMMTPTSNKAQKIRQRSRVQCTPAFFCICDTITEMLRRDAHSREEETCRRDKATGGG